MLVALRAGRASIPYPKTRRFGERFLEQLNNRRPSEKDIRIFEQTQILQTAHKRRSLRANLEFYKGVVYLALGLPKEFFTATFAIARIFGWSAHIVEQRKDNRIVRPSANYIGPAPFPD
jgi:citrate synthase